MVVYILFSEIKNRYYVGQTVDIEDRLSRHNNGLVKSTKYGIPWELVYTKNVLNRSEALRLGHKFKKRGAKRYIDNS